MGNWGKHDFNAPKTGHRGGRDPQIGDEYDKDGNFIDPNAAKAEEPTVIPEESPEKKPEPENPEEEPKAKKAGKKAKKTTGK